MDIITDVYIVSDDPDLSNKINGSFPGNPFFHFYDIGSMKDRSAAYKLKGQFGARLDPFAVVFSKDKAVKAFYTEADDHVIESLIKYLKEQ
jgi:hypothetical protein